MKHNRFFSYLPAALLLTGCASGAMLSSGALTDDLYYDSRNQLAVATPPQQVATQATPTDQSSYSSNKSVASQQIDNRNFSEIQDFYSDPTLNNQALVAEAGEVEFANADQVIYDDGENNTDVNTAYWEGGFNGSSFDQSYAERMIRFHGPFISASYYSTPFRIYARTSPDWNIYVDGNYVYYVPTWTNPFYDDFYYGTAYHWRHSSLYWSYGWNYGWYGHYYDPWYSWYSPYYYDRYYWGWGHSHIYHPHYAWGNHYYYGNSHYYYGKTHHYNIHNSYRHRYEPRGNSVLNGSRNSGTRQRANVESTRLHRNNGSRTTAEQSNRSRNYTRSSGNTSRDSYTRSSGNTSRDSYTRSGGTRNSYARSSSQNSSGNSSTVRGTRSSSTRSSTYTPQQSRSNVRSYSAEGRSEARPQTRRSETRQNNSQSSHSYTPSRSSNHQRSSSSSVRSSSSSSRSSSGTRSSSSSGSRSSSSGSSRSGGGSRGR